MRFAAVLLVAFACSGAFASSPAETPKAEPAAKPVSPNHLQQAAASSIFIYGANTKPCEPPPTGEFVLPLGSGLVVGIRDTSANLPAGAWRG